jgi:hypothetical protein
LIVELGKPQGFLRRDSGIMGLERLPTKDSPFVMVPEIRRDLAEYRNNPDRSRDRYFSLTIITAPQPIG